jgi:hypothetical protein
VFDVYMYNIYYRLLFIFVSDLYYYFLKKSKSLKQN